MGRIFHLPCADAMSDTTLFNNAGKEPVKVPRKGLNEHTKVLGVRLFWFRKDKVVWRKKRMPWGDQEHGLFNNHSNGWPERSAASPMTPEEWLARPLRGVRDAWGDVWYDATDEIHGIPIACGFWLMRHPFVPWKEFDYIVQLFAMEVAGKRMPELHYIPYEDVHAAIRSMDLEAWGHRWSLASKESDTVQEIWQRILTAIRKHDKADYPACRTFAKAFKGYPMQDQRKAMMHCLRTAQRQRDITEGTGNHYIWLEPDKGRAP